MSLTTLTAAARALKERQKNRNLPSVEIPRVQEDELARTLQGIQEHLRMYEGDSGAPKERFVTIAELENAGLIKSDVKGRFAFISQTLGKDVAQKAGSTLNPTQTDPIKNDTSRKPRTPEGGGGAQTTTSTSTAAKLNDAQDVNVSKPVKNEFLYYDGNKFTNYALFKQNNRWLGTQRFDKAITLQELADGPDALDGLGYLWVKDDTPNTLWFTNDAGTDTQLGTGGGSQTPWTADIDGAGFGLDNIDRLEIQASGVATDTATFTHDGTDFNTAFANTTDWNILNGVLLKIFDGSDTDYIQIDHDGTDANIRFATTTDLNIDFGAALSGQIKLFADTHLVSGSALQIRDGTNADTATFSHDGTDFNTAFVTTTDWNITGLTTLKVGNYTFNVDETVGAGQDNYVLTYDNGTGEIGLEAAGGGSQTPWTADVDAASFSLDNLLGLTIEDGTAADTANFTHDGTSFNASFGNTLDFNLIALTGNFWIRDGAGLKISDLGDTDFGIFTHDGTTFDLDFTNTSDWNIAGLTGNVWIRDGAGLKISNAGDSDFGIFSHDGTDFNTAFTLTTDWNITGLTYIRAGNYNFNIAETVGAGQDNYVLTYDNGTGLIGLEAAGGGSQTPWTGDIDGGGFGLDNIDRLEIQAPGVATDTATFTHDGTDFNTAFANTTDWNITGLTGQVIITASALGTGKTTSLQIEDQTGNILDAGFNVMRRATSANTSFTLGAEECGQYWDKTSGTAYTVTLAGSADLDFPVYGVVTLMNKFTSGDITVTEGSGTTLYYMDPAAGRVDTAGGCTIQPGGVATIQRAASTSYYIWGSAITA